MLCYLRISEWCIAEIAVDFKILIRPHWYGYNLCKIYILWIIFYPNTLYLRPKEYKRVFTPKASYVLVNRVSNRRSAKYFFFEIRENSLVAIKRVWIDDILIPFSLSQHLNNDVNGIADIWHCTGLIVLCT